MNTIIYVYQGRDEASFKIEKLEEADYCLIRLGLPVSLWKHIKQMDKEMQDKPGNEMTEEQLGQLEGSAVKIPVTIAEKKRTWKRSRQKRENSIWKRRKAATKNAIKKGLNDAGNNFMDVGREAQEQEALRTGALRQQVTALLEELEFLQTALCLLGGNTYWTYTVYEERLRTKIDTPSWWNAWKISEFENYSQPLWAEKILSHGDCPNLLVLGQSDCIPGMLVAGARTMRSIKWYLLQRDYTEETEGFIDNFYEEYGLAIELRLLENKTDWSRIRISSPEPVKVLDFSGEEKVFVNGVQSGSVWLDMNAMDAKRRRVEVRNQGIDYFSLKKHWSSIQKPVNNLDTHVKNRYNT